MKYKKGDKVQLPFNEEGIIVKVKNNLLWGCPYDIKITKATLSIKGEVADFREDQLKLKN